MDDVPGGSVGIAAVERDTGIVKETLRVWERRYGFPAPLRDAAGERLYPPEQVQRLRLLKRLLDAGHRPGRIVAAPLQELMALLAPAPGLAGEAPEVEACLALLQGHDVDALRRALSQALLRRGLAASVVDVFAPLAALVGERAAAGELQPFEERLCGEALQEVLRQAIQALQAGAEGPAGPRVLLSSLPGEGRAASLLMVQALLGLEGAVCLSLGAQLPPGEFVPAAAACQADVVMLAFTGQLPGRAALEGLAGLRERLPEEVEVWAVGMGRAPHLPHLQHLPKGIHWLEGLPAIAPALLRRRELLESPL